MNNLDFYKKQFSLQNASFSLIEHEDAMVAQVYRIDKADGQKFILKICANKNHSLREIYFIKYFQDTLPVPRIIQYFEPTESIPGAILMEYIPGSILKIEGVTAQLAYQAGSLLARIHQHRQSGYGDIGAYPLLNHDPRVFFTEKFEHELSECVNHLPRDLIDACKKYFNKNINSLTLRADGPCIVHRDYRPGNIIESNGRIQAIIDWSSALSGFAQEDFCTMEHTEWSRDDSSKKNFLQGYSTIRAIPHYDEILPLLRLSKAIVIVGFIAKRGINAKNNYLYNFNRQFLENFF